ncbi:MAG: NAD(P)-binding domain-containing protein, partial [Clostridiales bacterium]|nr:NAD(P)-binding domain-containing protein [Clostridiales bacterium]
LGKALAKGLRVAGFTELAICEATEELAQAARDAFGVFASCRVEDVMARADVVFLTVKKPALEILTPNMQNAGCRIVSFMAGVPLAYLERLLPNARITRGMPTLSIADGDGVIGYTPTKDIELAELFGSLGYAFEIAEEDIEKVTVMVASGIGLAAYVLDAFVTAGEGLGLERTFANTLATRAFADALRMGNYRELAQAVATKGGVTEQGILAFEEGGLFDLVNDAVRRAYAKATDYSS